MNHGNSIVLMKILSVTIVAIDSILKSCISAKVVTLSIFDSLEALLLYIRLNKVASV